MKIRDLSLSLNRENDTNISAILLPSITENEVDLSIQFRTITAYKQFIKKPVLTKDLFDDYDAYFFSTTEIEKIVCNEDFLKRLQDANLLCRVSRSKKENELILKQQFPITMNIRHLPFMQKLEIITNPFAGENTFFLDDYTENEELSSAEILDMYQYILNIAKKIKDKGYSQLESIFYIYNELKKKIYTAEKAHESKNKSRSLNQIINGDCIVCAGYTNYFLAISDILGLNVGRIVWKPVGCHKSGHASLIAYINDPKYEVQGIWGIDPTWDSKRNEYDQSYQNNLSHFLMPLACDENEKKSHQLENPSGNTYYGIAEALSRYQHLLEYQAPEVIIKNAKRTLLRRINRIYEMIGKKHINENNFDPETEINIIKSYANKAFPLFKLEELIENVTPKKETDLLQSVQSSPSFRTLDEDGKSIYRLVKLLKL